MTDLRAVYERVAAAASLEGPDAAIRIRASYEPIGGPGDKLSPPTYPAEAGGPYLLEQRQGPDGEAVTTVLLDSRQAQANRCEEALLAAIDQGAVEVPHLSLETKVEGRSIRITSLDAPHRSRDAYFRDAEMADGTLFDDTAPGQDLRAVTSEEPVSLYRHSPADLVYGVWDSHRKLRLAPRFPRIYTSEVVGFGAEMGKRAAGRFDLIVSGKKKVAATDDGSFSLDGKAGTKLSELGHGSIPPMLAPGGVTVSRVARTASLGFAGLARLRLDTELGPDGARAARALLAVTALLGDRLAFGRPAVFLRSGCELLLRDESLQWVGREPDESFDLDPSQALALHQIAREQAAAAGAAWSSEVITLRPQAKLQTVIEESYYARPDEDE